MLQRYFYIIYIVCSTIRDYYMNAIEFAQDLFMAIQMVEEEYFALILVFGGNHANHSTRSD